MNKSKYEYELMFTNEQIKVRIYELMFTNEQIKVRIYKLIFTNEQIKVRIYKLMFTNEQIKVRIRIILALFSLHTLSPVYFGDPTLYIPVGQKPPLSILIILQCHKKRSDTSKVSDPQAWNVALSLWDLLLLLPLNLNVGLLGFGICIYRADE